MLVRVQTPRLQRGCAVLVFLAIAAACSDHPDQSLSPLKPPSAGITGGGGAEVSLQPRVLINGEWRVVAGERLTTHTEKTEGGFLVHARFTADEDVVVQGIALHGALTFPFGDVRGWISNGFQSWSQSGVVALGEASTNKQLALDLSIIGDGETIRKGHRFSWWGTSIATAKHAATIGVVQANRWKSVVAPFREGDHVGLRLISGWTGEKVALKAGEELTSAQWFIGFDDLEAWPKAMAARHKIGALPPAEAGWNSWYELWDGVDAKAVLENAAIAKEMLAKPLVEARKISVNAAEKLRIVVDDGWQKAWGDWQPNSKFPQGLDGLAKQLHADGFEVGVWLAPLIASKNSDVYKAHPDWFVKGPTFPHTKIGNMHVLDVTHPDAATHLKGVIATIVGWGYTLLKIDFLFAGTWEGERHKDVTGIQAYRLAMQLIRDAAGEETLLLAVGAPAFPTVEYADIWRIGGDIAVEPFADPHFPFVANQLRMIASRWPMCRRMLCDPDPVMLRAMPDNEVDFGMWTVSLGGGGFFLSDDLRKLTKARRSWPIDPKLDLAPAISGTVTVPHDTFVQAAPVTLANALFDHLEEKSRHRVPVLWPGPSGDVAANVTSEALTVNSQTVAPHTVIPVK